MRSRIIFLAILGFLLACSKETDVLNRPPVPVIQSSDGVDRILLDGNSSSDPDGNKLTYTWSSSATNITISNANLASAYFKIPAGTVESALEVTLKVSDGKNNITSTQSITVPPLTQVRAYGLGRTLVKEVSNNVLYEWYIDQGNTGPFSLVNCGPTSVTMAIKWMYENFRGTPVDARNTYHTTGGWWFTNDITDYLNLNQVPNQIMALTTMKDLKDELDLGNIVILCLDMFYVTNGAEAEYRRDKFYATDNQGWGHFIVINGYKEVDDQTFFEAYDPYSFGLKYQDQAIKGKNRYYKSADLDLATGNWWDYEIVIARNGTAGGRLGVNTQEIVHMPGR